jgi:hypothetical protein
LQIANILRLNKEKVSAFFLIALARIPCSLVERIGNPVCWARGKEFLLAEGG